VFLFLQSFAKFQPEKKNDLSKGVLMKKNDQNLPEFEFFFSITKFL
jgi:hypothetical protein